MLDDIQKQRIDVAVIPYINTLERNHAVSFLPVIYYERYKIAIPTSAVTESVHFGTFIRPFRYSLWITVLSSIVIFSIAKSVLLESKENIFLKPFNYLWDSFMPMFGGTSDSSHSGRVSYNILLVTSLLCGYLIWTSYNAELTSELLVTKKAFPFSDLKGLASTRWR